MQDPPDIKDVLVKMETNMPVCRVCLNISTEYIEFESVLCLVDGLAVSYSDGFNKIAPSANNLPEKLSKIFCSSCGHDLLNAYLFRKRVENANSILVKINECIEESLTRTYSVDYLEVEMLNDVEEPRGDQDDACSDLDEKFVDVIEKEEGEMVPAAYQNLRPMKEKKKSTKSDEAWPASPKNSLYTDSDTESSVEDVSDKSELQEQKAVKFKEPTIWMCNDCGEICMSRGMLRKHRKHHQVANKSELKCNKCERPVETFEQLESHMCFHKFAELMSIESGKLFFRCKLCDRKYRSEVDFIDHINIHKDKRPYACRKCSETFHTNHLRRVHMLRFHKSTDGKIKKSSKVANIEKKEKCLHCYKMVRKSFMEIHKEVHFGPQNSMCTECGKQFGSQLALRTHSLIHKQRGEFHCHVCNKICQTKYALKSHIQFKHLMDKSLFGRKKLKYQCEDCGLIFQYPSKLRVHQRKHNAENPYKCPHCNRSYLRKDQFKIHMRYHNNDLPYKCDRCDKSYATKNNLTEHTRSVHDNVTYGCDKCNQKFKSATGLRKHKFVHTGYPYVCPMCGLGQPFRSGMKAHLLRVHKDTFTEKEFDERFPVMIPKSGFRRPKV